MRPAKPHPPLTDAQAQLAGSHVRIAYRAALDWVNRFRRRACPETVADAQQVACIALCQAAAVYDPGRGFKFSTLAYRCVFNLLRRWAEIEDKAVQTLPLPMRDLIAPEDNRHQQVSESLEWVRSRCTEEQRTLLDQYLAHDCVLTSLARQEGVSVEAIRSRLATVRKRVTRREVPGG